MLPVSGPHFENKGNCYQGWEKLTESEERKGTTGKIENHWKGREHSKDKIHTSPRNCPDCIYFTKLLPFPSLTVCFLSASSRALPVPADSIPLRLQGLVLRLLLYSNLLPSDLSPFAGFKFHMLMIPISSSDLLRLQDTQIQLPTWCFTLMNNRHLKINMSTYNPWLLPFPTNLFLPIIHSDSWGCHSWLLFFSTTYIQSICKPHQSALKTSWTWPFTTTSFFQAIIFLNLGDYNHFLPSLPVSSHYPPWSLLSTSARWSFQSFYYFMPCLWLKTLQWLPKAFKTQHDLTLPILALSFSVLPLFFSAPATTPPFINLPRRFLPLGLCTYFSLWKCSPCRPPFCCLPPFI